MRIGITMTTGLNCRVWEDRGTAGRELAYYDRLAEMSGNNAVLFSYPLCENEETSLVSKYAPRLELIPVNSFLPAFRYREFLSSFLYSYFAWNKTVKCDIYRSNQTNGAWLAWMLAKKHKAPFILRMGYLWSDNLKRRSSRGWKVFTAFERFLCREADRIIVPTGRIKEKICATCEVEREKIMVISNSVNTDLFKPLKRQKKRDVLMIGRLVENKNFREAIKAVHEAGLSVTIIGQGELSQELKDFSHALGIDVEWISRAPNFSLPELMAEHRYFMMPSLYEGSPKALLEAMACGMTCLGSDVDGIREVISHGRTGFLCGTDAGSIGSGLREMVSCNNPDKIGNNARSFMCDNYGMNIAVKKEIDIYNDLLNELKGKKQ